MLGSRSVGIINPGKSVSFSVSKPLPPGTTATGKYLVALIDVTDVVGELDENYNCKDSGPIPSP